MRLSSKPFKQFAETFFEGKNTMHNYISGMTEIGVPRIFYCEWLDDGTVQQKKDKEFIKKQFPNCCFNHKVGLPTRKWEGDDATAEQIPVPLTRHNKALIDMYHKHKKLSLNKCRGSGASEIITIRYMVFKYAVLNQSINRKCVIVPGTSNKLSHELSTRIKAICDKIPQVYGKVPTSAHPEVFEFTTGGKILLTSATADAIRGFENIGDIILEEVAHWDMVNDMPVYNSSQAVHTKTQCHVLHLTTPRGMRGFYYNLVWDKEAKSDFYKHKTNWREIVGLPVEKIETLQEHVAEHGLITPKNIKEWRVQLKQHYIDDEHYTEWFDTFFEGLTIDEVCDVEIGLLDINSIVRDSITFRPEYDQELDNQFIASDNRAIGDFREEDYDPLDLREQIASFEEALELSKEVEFESPDY